MGKNSGGYRGGFGFVSSSRGNPFSGGGRSRNSRSAFSGGGPRYGTGYYGGSYSSASSYSYTTESWDALQANIAKKRAADAARQLKAETIQVYNDAEAAQLNLADDYRRRNERASAVGDALKGIVDGFGRKG